MTYRGHIKNGVAVLDDDAACLPEGSAVLIQVEGELESLADVFQNVIGKGKDLPSDGSIEHDHYIYGTPKIAEPAQVPTLSETFGDLIGSCPDLPKDMAENHDHYLHGQQAGDEVEDASDSLAELFRRIDGKAKGFPDDASLQHDHYIYGTPKR